MAIAVLLLVQFFLAIVMIASGLAIGLQLHSPRRCAKVASTNGLHSLTWLPITLAAALALLFAFVATFVASALYILAPH